MTGVNVGEPIFAVVINAYDTDRAAPSSLRWNRMDQFSTWKWIYLDYELIALRHI